MNDHVALIEKFYTCFQQLDADGMAGCYHGHVVFSDPVFPNLNGPQVGAMWKMLCSQARDFELTFDAVRADAATGGARWEARYTFSRTGRRVRNKIDATFRFQDGKIIGHHDDFNFWRWSTMALGPIGIVLGWTPLLKKKVKQQAAKRLARFIEKTDS